MNVLSTQRSSVSSSMTQEVEFIELNSYYKLTYTISVTLGPCALTVPNTTNKQASKTNLFIVNNINSNRLIKQTAQN